MRVTVDCNDSRVFSSRWFFYNGDFYNETTNLTGIPMNQTKATIPIRTLAYGQYKICGHVEMNIDPRFRADLCGFLQVKVSPLTAIIQGGGSLTIPREDEVSFNYIIISWQIILTAQS